VNIIPAPDGDKSSISNAGTIRRHRPAADALAETVADATTTWPATLRLCLIGLAFSLPALAVIALILVTR
jgi:hypothetical protein